MSRSICRLLRRRVISTSVNYSTRPRLSIDSQSNPVSTARFTRSYSSNIYDLRSHLAAAEKSLQEITFQAQRERMREREERLKSGLDVADIDKEEEDEEDHMGLGPFLDKLEKKLKDDQPYIPRFDEQTDSDSDDDEELSREEMNKRFDQFEKKHKKHEELLDKFTKAGL